MVSPVVVNVVYGCDLMPLTLMVVLGGFFLVTVTMIVAVAMLRVML